MAKRNKAKFASKSRKSALRVEALEQRQLLAAVTGGGTEVGSDIQHPNGNVYDQVLMTGSSVTVTADPGQVTRVSFVDTSGDIVQAEFSGPGSLTITLDDFAPAAPAENYNQPGVNYVSGHATFTIQGSEATTNFSVFSVGPGNAVNPGLFEGGKDGGNNIADVQAIVIVGNPQNPGTFTNFGGIRAGNAVFSGNSGNVGITGVNINVQGPVVIGDVDASDVGVPVLNFNAGSQFNTLTVAGGDLVQTNGQAILGGANAGISSVNFTAGATSLVGAGDAADIGAKVNPNPAGIFSNGAPDVATLDAVTEIDITGKTQAEITALFSGRTFINDITIIGDLNGVQTLSAAAFRGDVTFTGVLAGDLVVDNEIGGVLTLEKANTGDITASSIGGISAAANLNGTVRANTIGDVSITGDLNAEISTDANKNGKWDQGEKGIGDVSVTGGVTSSGKIFGVLGIGDVSVGKDVQSAEFLKTSSGTTGDAFVANIGTVTVDGDARGGGAFINIAGNGNFGDIIIKGGGTNTAAHDVGTITVAGELGAAGTTTGAISITDNTNATTALKVGAITIGAATNANGSLGSITVKNTSGNVEFGGVNFNGTGSVGDIELIGSGAKNSSVEITGNSSLSTGTGGVSLGNITLSNAEDLVITGKITAKSIGDITATSINNGGSSSVVVGGTIVANGGSIGNVQFDATSTANSVVTISGDINTSNVLSNGSASIGTVTLTGKTINVNGAIQAPTIGAVTHTGATVFGDGEGYQALKSFASFTAVGDTEFNSNAGPNIRVGGSGAPDFMFTGTTTFKGGTNPAILGSNGHSSLDALGDFTFNGRVVGVAGKIDISASSIGDISISGALNTNESLVTDFNVYAGNNSGTTTGAAEAVAVDGSNLSSFAIGNISITSTNTIGIAGTALLEGANTFNAIGKIGDVSLQAGGSAAVQTSLFQGGTGNALLVQTGNGNVAGNMIVADSSGIDFDGNGTLGNGGAASTGLNSNITGAIETGSTFSTSATVSIGSVSINAASEAGDPDTVLAVGQTGTTEGLYILSGVKGDGSGFETANIDNINDNLRGTVGNISITNLSQQLSVQGPYAALAGIATPDAAGLIAATAGNGTASPYGTINGLSTASGGTNLNLTSSGNVAVLVGNDDAADTATGDTIVVIRV